MITLPFLQKSPKRPSKFITLSISSEDVKCAVFYDDPTESKLKILGAGRQGLSKDSSRAGIIVEEENVENAAGEAIKRALENTEDDVSHLIIAAGNATVLGITTTIRYRRKEPGTLINDKEVARLYERISEAAYIEAQNEYRSSTGNADEPLEIITTSNVSLKIDGHSVKDLEGNAGLTIEAGVYHAFCPEYHVKALQSLAKKLGLNILAIGSGMYCAAQWVKKITPEVTDYILVDVAEDTTNVSVVFGRGIVATKFLSLGYKHFVEQIAERMGVTMEEAGKLLKSYLNSALSDPEMEVVGGCIREAIKIWVMGIEILFGEFTGVKTFPSKIFLQGAGAEVPEVVEALKKDSWAKNIPFRETREVQLMEMDGLPVVDATGSVKGKDWFSNAALSIIYKEIFDN
ncbi:hypothetical protein A2380_02405 [candidate division WWE3 bacterium RIFOXYB1_FULL_43_24]|uniref:Cell division protein (Septum formation) n=2 Tax=Katanobacteria TaxID=422282 RepID=A0A0G0YJL8_UNCKA|nr:MAG: cell division protein (septum formation) [candidate division WWE3 bacterium GW2011_GWA1_42_12]KKS33743.1 MAG: cell division protein (septum formation) [candidate division WWE3 bacterium GW2011_GWD1_42_14]KKS36905.1 MAG: cell division protein (septum formation) [candidate division WWE3 bacterium GW2011_GWF1_42_14]KKS39778.1 MAG: cell division protein (septum formation) [candidate division WWE3 bacterium GW2011_GWE1_42_16]KKS65918.1 MAG: cell division protein (septum formation) [candidate